jgi:ABC-type amino acid transport substrate-binding protein
MLKQKSICSFLLLLLVSVFLFGNSLSDAYSQSLVIGVDREYRPHYWTDGGKIVGPTFEVCTTILKKLGFKIRVKVTPWSRVLHELEKGGSDLVCLLVHKKERENYATFAKTEIARNRYQLITSANSGFDWKGDSKDLEGFYVGAVRKWAYPLFENKNIKRIDFDSEKLVVRSVALNTDVIGIGLRAGLKNAIEEMVVQNKVRFLEPALPEHRLYTGFSKRKGLEKLAKAYSEALSRFKKTEEYRQIYKKYGMEPL